MVTRTRSQGADQPAPEVEQALLEERRSLKAAKATLQARPKLAWMLKEVKPPKAPKAPKAAKEPKEARAANANKPSRPDKPTKKAAKKSTKT
jgi:hypothetical protein